MNESWIVRPYRPGDEGQLLELFNTCFGRPITEAYWRWKLQSWLTPVENIWVAVAGERIIGHYAGIPSRLWLEGDEKLVMVAVDGMVHPDFRRRGVLTDMVTQSHLRWQEARVAFVIGLPNQQWRSRKEALGWQEFFFLKWKIRLLHLEALFAHRLSLPVPRRFIPVTSLWNRFWDRQRQVDPLTQVRLITKAGPEFDQLWQRIRSNLSVSLIRDSRWLQWRYLAVPAWSYSVLLAERAGQPVGYAVYREQESIRGKIGLIAEIFTDPTDEGAYFFLLRQILQRLKKAGAILAMTLVIPGTTSEKRFGQMGFLFSPGTFDVRLVPLEPQLPLELLRQPANWIMAGGDFDVI